MKKYNKRFKSNLGKYIESHDDFAHSRLMQYPNISYLDRLNDNDRNIKATNKLFLNNYNNMDESGQYNNQFHEDFGHNENESSFFKDTIKMRNYYKVCQDLDNLKKWFGFMYIIIGLLSIFVYVLFNQNGQQKKLFAEQLHEIESQMQYQIEQMKSNMSIMQSELSEKQEKIDDLKEIIKDNNYTVNRKIDNLEDTQNNKNILINQQIKEQINESKQIKKELQEINVKQIEQKHELTSLIDEKQKEQKHEFISLINDLNLTFRNAIKDNQHETDIKLEQIKNIFTKYIEEKINNAKKDINGEINQFYDELKDNFEILKENLEKFENDSNDKHFINNIISALGSLAAISIHFII